MEAAERRINGSSDCQSAHSFSHPSTHRLLLLVHLHIPLSLHPDSFLLFCFKPSGLLTIVPDCWHNIFSRDTNIIATAQTLRHKSLMRHSADKTPLLKTSKPSLQAVECFSCCVVWSTDEVITDCIKCLLSPGKTRLKCGNKTGNHEIKHMFS